MTAIIGIEAIPVRIPLLRPMQLASEVIGFADNLIVRVLDAEGVEGWGEAASAPTMTGETLRRMVDAVDETISPRLIGRDVEDRADWMKAIARIAGTPAARAAVEVALHDLLGRRRNVPVWRLLEGNGSRPAPLIRTLAADSSSEELAPLLDEGVTHFKVKVGIGDPATEARSLTLLREALGTTAHLSADANMAWTLDESSLFVREAAPAALDYLEQPLSAKDISGMAALALQTDTPLCLDEALSGAQTILDYHRRSAARGAGLKLLKLGGFSGAIEAEAAARQCAWRTTWASKIAETSIGCSATLHAASISEDLGWGLSLTQDRLAGDLVTESLNSSLAVVRPPEGPGLGVQPDIERLNRFRNDQ